MNDDFEQDDFFRYDKLIEHALRSVIRDALEKTVLEGLPGEHHFYITFATDYPGVNIPEYLHEQYPEEMTIVLQYQFTDLLVEDEKFSVTLSFNNIPEKLVIPYDAIISFADPSVNFALQFQPSIIDDEDDDEMADTQENLSGEDMDAPARDIPPKTGDVVALDAFRKKKT